MKDKIKFSVVVPIYNIENYLNKCIDSLLAQTYGNLEIILVDDGSTDSCSSVCDEYAVKDNRIIVIHKENGGLISARQTGAIRASGDYVACVDGDDWVDEKYFEKFADIIDGHAPDIVCCSNFTSDGENFTPTGINIEEGFYSKEDIEQKIFPFLIEDEYGRYFSTSIWAKIFKRELYLPQQTAVDKRIVIGEDSACVKPCVFNANSIYISSEPLYFYRYNPSSLTKSRKAFDWKGPLYIAMHYENQMDLGKGDLRAQVYRSTVHSLFNVAVSQFNRKEKYRTLAREIKENLKEPFYRTAIENCKFRSKSGRIALFALKHKSVMLMKLYNKIK